METTKKRAVVSYENMPEEVSLAFAEKYPRGLADYLPDVQKIDKPDGSSIYTVTIEIPSAIYLVKVQIKIDDIEDLDRWLDSDDSEEDSSEDNGEALPDENISQYGSDDDSQETDE